MSNECHEAIEKFIPHRQGMRLLGEVVAFENERLSATVKTADSKLFAEPNGVPSWLGIEYMAQAIAAYSTARHREIKGSEIEPRLGMLLGCRQFECNVSHFPVDCELAIEVQEDFLDETGLGVFSCVLKGRGIRATGRLTVMEVDEADD